MSVSLIANDEVAYFPQTRIYFYGWSMSIIDMSVNLLVLSIALSQII